jgi:hypothetical protein
MSFLALAFSILIVDSDIEVSSTKVTVEVPMATVAPQICHDLCIICTLPILFIMIMKS